MYLDAVFNVATCRVLYFNECAVGHVQPTPTAIIKYLDIKSGH